jgi:hypothetical protein
VNGIHEVAGSSPASSTLDRRDVNRPARRRVALSPLRARRSAGERLRTRKSGRRRALGARGRGSLARRRKPREGELGESTAAPIPGRLGICLSGGVLVAGGIAAHAGAVTVGGIDGAEQRVQPTPERAWVLASAPVAPPTSLTIRETNANGEVLDVAETGTGPDPAKPRSALIHDAGARIRRQRSGAFPSGRTSY